uniref:transposase n=1 Tax=Saccharicrinis sp. 156 TaxID=3417574 RepID=UPI003D348F1D
PNPAYNVEHFKYNKTSDCYICPEQQKLVTTGKVHQAKTYQFKRYTTKACLCCQVKDQCSKAKYGKAIQRSEYQELIELNKERVRGNENYYKRRQAIVEHPYGTIKRQWGFNYIITVKYIDRAEADLGLIMNAYNLRRIINIIGKDQLVKYLRSIAFVLMPQKVIYRLFLDILSHLLIKTNYYHYFQFVNRTA